MKYRPELEFFLVGALAGAASVALLVFATRLPALGAVLAVVWGVLTLWIVLEITARLLNRATSTTIPFSAPAPAETDTITDTKTDTTPAHTVYFSTIPSAAVGMAPAYGALGHNHPQPPPEPPAPTPPPPAQPAPGERSWTWLADLPGFQEPDTAPNNVAPWANIDTSPSIDEPDILVTDEPSGLLHRRPPQPSEYPLIAETLRNAQSQNQALRLLWGYKDGRTTAWLKQVVAYYSDYSHLPIWMYEILIAPRDADDPVAIAHRCGHTTTDLASILADLADYNIIRCTSCGHWHEAEQTDIDAGLLLCLDCRES